MAIQPRPLRSLAVLALLSLISVGCQGALRGTTGTEVGGSTQRKLGTLTGMELIRTDTDVKVADLVKFSGDLPGYHCRKRIPQCKHFEHGH
jgi:hypothetical protein